MKCSNPNCPNKNSASENDSFETCLSCKRTPYCSPQCRSAHWESHHKNVCPGNPHAKQPDSPTKETQDKEVKSETSKPQKKKKTIDDYEIVTLPDKEDTSLGTGTFGEVKLVREKTKPDKLYALKAIDKKVLKAYSSADSVRREIKIHKKLKHPHIIKLFHCFEDKDYVYIVLEYAENGTLYSYLREKKKLPEKEAFVYFFQTTLGIHYLHKRGILHRDLKLENLLLNKRKDIKVCDFGWSAEEAEQRNTFCGTVDYMAPEMVRKEAYNHTVDIWSLGILLYELLHGYTPFTARTMNEKFRKILDNEVTYGDISQEAKDLISSILHSDASKRLTFEQIFTHPWILRYEKEFSISIEQYVSLADTAKDKSTPGKRSSARNSQNPKMSLRSLMDDTGSISFSQLEESKTNDDSIAHFLIEKLEKEKGVVIASNALTALAPKPDKQLNAAGSPEFLSFGPEKRSLLFQSGKKKEKQNGEGSTPESPMEGGINKSDQNSNQASGRVTRRTDNTTGSRRTKSERDPEDRQALQKRGKSWFDQPDEKAPKLEKGSPLLAKMRQSLAKKKNIKAEEAKSPSRITGKFKSADKSQERSPIQRTRDLHPVNAKQEVAHERIALISNQKQAGHDKDSHIRTPKNEQQQLDNKLLQTEESRRQTQQDVKALIESGKNPEDIRKEALRRYKNRFHQIQRLSYEDPANYDESAIKESTVDPFLITSEKILTTPEKKKEPLLEKSDNLLGSDKKEDGLGAEWEKILEDPKLAKIWLEKRDAKKNLDLSFIPKELIYTYKTIDQSYSDLQKKTKELQNYFKESEYDEEEEEVRVSRPSYKQRREITPIRAPKKQKPTGIFDKVAEIFGCFKRENPQ